MAATPTAQSASARLRPGPDATGGLPCLGGWQLVQLCAEGNLCRVYRAGPMGGPAEHPADYAVKTLLEQWQNDSAAIETLRREAIVGRKVSHPHLIPILAAHVGAPPYFVVMPWLTGATLAEKLRSGWRPSLPVALWLARQVAEALAALHAAGWMHADVKSSNVFVSPEGHVTLLDLGFARRTDETGSAVDRCVVGTMGYIAPEMITSALRTDIRNDLYSLGVTLFELLAGRLPFTGQSLAELAEQHRQCQPPRLRALAPHLPRGVTRLVHQMLAKEPLRRPQTPGEVVERLVALEIETFGMRNE